MALEPFGHARLCTTTLRDLTRDFEWTTETLATSCSPETSFLIRMTNFQSLLLWLFVLNFKSTKTIFL
jgi:hypothetical protein